MANKVLITQGTRPFAQRVGKLLQAQQTVQFGTADEIPHVLLQTGDYVRFAGVDTPAFEHEILRTCLDNGIDVLIPLGEAEVYLLSRAQALFAEYGIAMWIPDAIHLAQLEIIRNPERRYPLLVLDHGVAVAGEQQGEYSRALSGVFTRPTPNDELVLCCITD